MRVALIQVVDNDTKPNWDKGRWSLEPIFLEKGERNDHHPNGLFLLYLVTLSLLSPPCPIFHLSRKMS